ncbi:MAG: 16S rRNA (guanine(966)-N(2))-methyltransferase RsmD [Gammaproteobacteria bacterium]
MTRSRGELRIVGGAWRSRRVRFPATPGLRPTPDRVRETVFNWLGPWVEGRRVLDLFAGSGALGLEALSRGATEAVFVECARSAAEALQINIEILGAAKASVLCTDALRFLERTEDSFDLVFIDPPYAGGLAWPVLERLLVRRLLRTGGQVYLEQGGSASLTGETFEIPPPLHLHREVHAGSVHGFLLSAY